MMGASSRGEVRMPKGVQELHRPRRGRRYRARIRHGKRGEVHLGLYETPWLAAFAYNVAAQALGRASVPPNPIPHGEQPGAERVREITGFVRRRLGLDPPAGRLPVGPPSIEDLLTLFEVSVVGFWRSQAARSDPGGDDPIDAAARRLVDATRLLFWSRDLGHPDPAEAMADSLAHRLDLLFRRPDLTREILDDDGDDAFLLARWLVHPDTPPAGGGRGFRAEVRALYPEFFESEPEPIASSDPPTWAAILGLVPPFSTERVRAAYRSRSRDLHPDAGGSPAEFVRLKAAYEAARRYCEDLEI